MDKYQVGDSVQVDLTGLYLGLCECGERTLMVPGGSCSVCGSQSVEHLAAIGPEDMLPCKPEKP